MKSSNLSEIFAGKRHITAELAYRIEQILDIDAEFWLRSQIRHDITVVRNMHAQQKAGYRHTKRHNDKEHILWPFTDRMCHSKGE